MINQLKPYYVGEKIRLGNMHDGGYVLPKQLMNDSNYLFSYGISDDISFDEDYIKHTGNSAYGYDHTINDVHTNYPQMFILHKEGLSGTLQETTNNFINHYRQKGCFGRALLKVDVEGAEYEWLENTDIQQLAKITTGIIIEFHELNDESFRNRFVNIIEELNKYFCLCHIHGNNYGGTFQYEEWENMPRVIELTFAAKDITNTFSEVNELFPTNLDAPNNPDLEDIELNFNNNQHDKNI